MKSNRCLGAVFALLALALGACSDGSQATAGAAQPSQWLAVARGKVDVEGGMLQVAARVDGVVESVAVQQGDAVKAGQVLAQLDPRAAKIQVASAQAGVEQAQAQLVELRVALQQARQRAPRIATAAKAGAATGEAAEQARAAVATLVAKQSAAAAAVDVARQQLAAAQLNLGATSLRAPVAGDVVARRIAIGQSVAAASGQPLFELLPDRPHIVRAQIDVDEDGYFYLVDRKKDMIISGGFNVYPQMIEQAIYTHPDVHEVLVIGVPDDYRGEAAKAFVKLKPDVAAFTLDELRAFLTGKVGKHELPAALEFVDELPRTAVGKLSRHELRSQQPSPTLQHSPKLATGGRS